MKLLTLHSEAHNNKNQGNQNRAGHQTGKGMGLRFKGSTGVEPGSNRF
jgi:hypothetical protein